MRRDLHPALRERLRDAYKALTEAEAMTPQDSEERKTLSRLRAEVGCVLGDWYAF